MRGEAASRADSSRAGSMTAAALSLARNMRVGGTGYRNDSPLSAKASAAACRGAVRVPISNIHDWRFAGATGLPPPAMVRSSAMAVTVTAP